MSIPHNSDFHHGLLGLLKSRLHTEFGSEARVHSEERHGQFEVVIEMPAVTVEADRSPER